MRFLNRMRWLYAAFFLRKGRHAAIGLVMTLWVPCVFSGQETPAPVSQDASVSEGKRILARQFLVDVEKTGTYSIDILFSFGEDVDSMGSSVEKIQGISSEAFKKIEGKIYIYDYGSSNLVHEISLPIQRNKKAFYSYNFLGKEEIGEGYPTVEIKRKGMYIIRPELVSHYPGFADYTLSLRRIYHTK